MSGEAWARSCTSGSSFGTTSWFPRLVLRAGALVCACPSCPCSSVSFKLHAVDAGGFDVRFADWASLALAF
eukprot:4579516-Pyramimonas_sp.AAC.1